MTPPLRENERTKRRNHVVLQGMVAGILTALTLAMIFTDPARSLFNTRLNRFLATQVLY